MEEIMAWWNNVFGGGSGFSQSDINNWGTLLDPFISSNIMANPWAEGYSEKYNAQYENVSNVSNVSNMEGVPTGVTPQIEDISTRSVFDRPNLLNAGVTMALTGLSTFASAWSSKSYYNYYQQQEEAYLENAKIQADRLQLAGLIEAANIRAKHAITQGQNELAVVGAGAGSISGSFADFLTANRKNDMRDEYAQDLSTLYAVSNAKRQGLTQAFNTAGQAYALAIKQRNASVSRLFSGLAEGVGSILADIRTKRQADSSNTQAAVTQTNEYERKMRYYGNRPTGTAVEATGEVMPTLLMDGEDGSSLLDMSGGTLMDALKLETDVFGLETGATSHGYNLIDVNQGEL